MTCRAAGVVSSMLALIVAAGQAWSQDAGPAERSEAPVAPQASEADARMTADEANRVLSPFHATKPALFVGDKAPALQVATWVQGDPVKTFEEDHVYVVEMWATWCGPCIKVIPHLNELHKKYQAAGEKVTFIGMNISEREQGEARVTKIQRFVEQRADDMTYTVAIEDGRKMSETWMAPAEQRGIPASFIVDGAGRIGWIGHPAGIDEPLERIVKGEHDAEQAAKNALADRRADAAFQRARSLLGNAEAEVAEEAYRLIEALALTDKASDAGWLNAVSWSILTHPAIKHRDNPLATRMAKQAADITEWKSADILDTLARAYWETGRRDMAVDTQRKALGRLGDDEAELREQLQARLDEYLQQEG